MSVIVEFFVAPDDQAAAAVVDEGPEGLFETLVYGNFDVLSALAEWESILTDRDLDYGRVFDALDIVAQPDVTERRMIFMVPEALQDALRSADPERLADTARRWTEEHGTDHRVTDPASADRVLNELAGLARTAATDGAGCYCWMC